MSTVGLTKAMERDLRLVLDGRASLIPQGRINGLTKAGFLDAAENVTPRGHAALAAPRMTQAELELLELMERSGHAFGWIGIGSPQRRTAQRLRKSGLAEFDCVDCWNGRLNAAGRTALNNVRAAMGSPDHKEGL